MFRGEVEEYWLPTPFACFHFTSPPVRHRVPSGFKRALRVVRSQYFCYLTNSPYCESYTLEAIQTVRYKP